MKTFDIKTSSYPGRDKANEDYILCSNVSENCFVAILADGMGGLSYGAEAARIVSESILATILDKIQEHSPKEVLRLAFETADFAIHEKCRELKCKMGAAATVALIVEDSLYYAWQGNVRLYKVVAGKLSLMTTDHVMNETEGTFLTQCVNGKGYRENIPIMQENLEQLDKVYICSDGYYELMDLNEIINLGFTDVFTEDDASAIVIEFF